MSGSVSFNKVVPLILVVLVAACSSYRPSGDHEIAAKTGIRTMRTWDWTPVESSMKAAQKECETEGKKYVHLSHNDRDMGTVQYRCD